METEFIPFPKIARLFREIIITEKLDGTNASVHVGEDGSVFAASRTRWITPEADNYGFAKWVKTNESELRKLGPGSHFGEWWGSGIQRGYGLNEKRFSLFNVGRWDSSTPENTPPACCLVVPMLYRGPLVLESYHPRNTEIATKFALNTLRTQGSIASPGFRKPEGIVIYHAAAKTLFKVTLENDSQPKGA